MALQNPGGIPEGGGFVPVVVLDLEQESSLRQLSQLELYWRRFRNHRLALVGFFTIVALILMAVLAPLLTGGVQPYQPQVELGFGGHPPTLENFPWRIFGTTGNLNGSVWSQIAYGARISLFIGFAAAFISALVGTIFGAVSGYFGGWVDMLLMRITDVFLSIPALPLLIAISAIYSHGNNNPLVVIAIFSFLGWPGIARLVRASYLSFREQEFTEAAKATGVNDWRIIFRHILPNALSPVIVAATLAIAGVIVGEATLDFLGVGINFQMGDPLSFATWGNILADSQGDIIIGDWWWPCFPGLFLVITVLAANFIGDGLRDALDVRTRLN